MATTTALTPAPSARKKLLRRTGVDRSQALRRAVQLAFFALNAWIGVEFYLFVRYYETGGQVRLGQPAGRRRRLAAHRVDDEFKGTSDHRARCRACTPRGCSC